MSKLILFISPKNNDGFSLIELLAAISIVAILAALAFPSYSAYVVNAKRSAAQQHMIDIARRQADFLIDNNSYTETIGAGGLGLTAPGSIDGLYTFAVTLSSGPPPGYLITATAAGNQVDDGDLTLDNDGIKSPADKW